MLKLKFTPRTAASLVAALFVVTATQMAWAVGTDAGTTVSNTATINFTLSGVPQALTSNTLTFEVDRQIDMTVTWQDGTNVGVIPGTTAAAPAPFAVLTYTVQNTGNDFQDFNLAVANNPNGTPSPDTGNDGFDAGPATLIFVEDGTTPGYQVAEDTATFIDELAENATQTVYVVSDIAGGTAAGLIAVMSLTATAHDGGAAGLGALSVPDGDGDDPNLVENVFADAGRDGQETADGAYVVNASDIAISKSTLVLDDQLPGGPEYAIPGAIVQYEIQITNNHPTDTATGVTITDDISGEIGQIAFFPDGYAVGFGIQLQINAGAPTNLSNAADADQGDFNAGTNVVTVNGITLTPGDTAFVRFTVQIQ